METAVHKIWLCILVILFLTAPVSAFRADIVYKKPYADANKTIQADRDDIMCWAASAANMVAWHQGADAQITFEWLLDNLKPGPGLIGTAINKLGWKSKLEWIEADDLFVDLWILGSLIKGQPVVVAVIGPIIDAIGHSLTVYGLKINSKGIFITYVDSDDNTRKIYTAKLHKRHNFLIFSDGEFKGKTIYSVYSLKK
jgi:hypothetical protein